MNKWKLASLLLTMLWGVMCFPALTQTRSPLYLDARQPIAARVKSAMALMTLAEKVALTHGQSSFSSPGVPRLGIPALWMDDGPHGIRAETGWANFEDAHQTNDSCTAFPALSALAATWNPACSYLYGKAIGEEARYRNKSVLLGPGVNIYRHPFNGRNFEYMGEDPYLSSVMVVPYIQGVQSNGVAACVKHFALNNQETHRFSVNVKVSDRALNEIYLPAFKAAVMQGHVMSAMAAYNKVNGVWCSENDILLKKILKHDWHFDGVVISDWSAVHSTLPAAENGLDIEMGTSGPFDEFYFAKPYLKALLENKASMAGLDDKVKRILTLIFRTAMKADRPWGKFTSDEHYQTARKIADEAIVLLKNNNHLLPLDLTRIKTIAVIGENATRSMTIGGGSTKLRVQKEISPLEGLRARLGGRVNIVYSQGYAHIKKDSKGLAEQAIEAAAKADMVLFVGGLNKDGGNDTEGIDRKTMDLPYGQSELIAQLQKVNPNIVVTLVSGNAVAMPWVNDVPAILQAWYCGSEAGDAIADVLTGDVNPSGKLPFTFPQQMADVPAVKFGEFPGDSLNVAYNDDIWVGYRYYDTYKVKPLFPFGFGLSYTTFQLSSIKTAVVNGVRRVTLNVSNTGKVAGAEVVQIYVHEQSPTIKRLEKELKAFQKVYLKPGEQRQVTFSLKDDAFMFYDPAKGWTKNRGVFDVLAGISSTDIKLKTSININ